MGNLHTLQLRRGGWKVKVKHKRGSRMTLTVKRNESPKTTTSNLLVPPLYQLQIKHNPKVNVLLIFSLQPFLSYIIFWWKSRTFLTQPFIATDKLSVSSRRGWATAPYPARRVLTSKIRSWKQWPHLPACSQPHRLFIGHLGAVRTTWEPRLRRCHKSRPL